ncbi:MAG: GntR family transcriptional regulator [Colwellia sp.]|nr:GntR family transcriptional regulator [Colwellia sp.]
MEKVAEYIENHFISSISSGVYSEGDALPSERALASTLKVDRCSLRTALKAIEKDGWITIKQGKPTLVHSFFDKCNLNAALKRASLIKDSNSDKIKQDACQSLQEICTVLFKNEEEYITLLKTYIPLPTSNKDFTIFEIDFSIKLIELTNNKVYKLLLNQLVPLFEMSSLENTNDISIKLRRQKYLSLLP